MGFFDTLNLKCYSFKGINNIYTGICLNFICNKMFLKSIVNKFLFCRTALKEGESSTPV